MPFAVTCMDLEIIILSEVSQTERQISYTISYMWNLKYDTNELIYKTDSQTQKTNLWLPKEKWGGERDELGVWDQQIQTAICKIDKQQGSTVQHREQSKWLL